MSRAILVACALVLGGCAGPKAALRIEAKTVAVDVEFGKPELVVPEGVAPPQVDVQLVDGGVVLVPRAGSDEPPPVRVRVSNEPIDLCPEASEIAQPSNEATPHAQVPAPEGAYDFRTSGSYTYSGGKTAYPTIKRLVKEAQGGRFTVDEIAGGYLARTTYLADDVQIGLASLEVLARGSGFRFAPPLPVRILQLPPVQQGPTGGAATSWRSAGTDPTSGVTMTVEGNVAPLKERVDACGELIDSWAATEGIRLVGPFVDLTIAGRWNFATQFAGMIVAQDDVVSGTMLGAPYAADFQATINRVP